MSDYKIVYVTSGTPRLDGVELPGGVTWCSTQYAEQECGSSARENTIWVVRGGTDISAYIRQNGIGYISTFSSRNPTSWLNTVKQDADAGNLNLAADQCEKRGFQRKTMAPCVTIDATTIKSTIIDKPFVGASIKQPATPHTTLVTNVDIAKEVDPVGDVMHYASEASRLDGLDSEFPEGGMITLKWEKVAGRDQLRKFTVTVDYKESN